MDVLLIILFASVAAFFGVRLYTLLGRREGHEGPPPGLASEPELAAPATALDAPTVFTGPAAAGMEDIRRADGVFEPQSFVTGARKAYEMIVQAFADGDRGTLESLLTPYVYAKWAKAIDDREAAGLRQVSDIVRIMVAEIEAASLTDDRAAVSVRFEAEIAAGQTDADGAVVDGDPAKINKVIEVWTFERDVTSSDPAWSLAKVGKG